MAAGDKLRTRG